MAIISVETHASMGHRLPSYDGLCSSLHGHNVVFRAAVHVKQDKFLDFKVLRDALARITDPMDHALVLDMRDPWAPLMKNGSVSQRLVLLDVEPTTEAIASYVFQELSRSYDVQIVTVQETEKYSATCNHMPEPRIKRVI